MVVRSNVSGLPDTSLPRKIGICILLAFAPVSSITSRKRTICCDSLGTSIPTVFFPGIGATMRTLGTRNAIATSSAKPDIFDSLKPASSSTSYWAITGPVSTSTTFTRNPKLANVFSSNLAFLRTSLACSSKCISSAGNSSSLSGNS